MLLVFILLQSKNVSASAPPQVDVAAQAKANAEAEALQLQQLKEKEEKLKEAEAKAAALKLRLLKEKEEALARRIVGVSTDEEAFKSLKETDTPTLDSLNDVNAFLNNDNVKTLVTKEQVDTFKQIVAIFKKVVAADSDATSFPEAYKIVVNDLLREIEKIGAAPFEVTIYFLKEYFLVLQIKYIFIVDAQAIL